jgi:ketosteroid isomerase-like protein
MSEEPTTPDPNGQLRRHIEAGNRGDFDAAFAIFSERAVWDRSPVGQEVFEGRGAIRNFVEDWNAVFEDYVLGVEDFHDLRSGVTFGLLSQRGRPHAGGGVVEEPYAAVVVWKDGLIVRVTVYPALDEARAAAERLAKERG